MGRCNNQPNNGVISGEIIGEETWSGAMHGGGHLLVILGGELSNEKRERATWP